MANRKDDWGKPRSRGTHLTESEKATIMRSLRNGRPAREVARELACSTRIVTKYYSLFRADGSARKTRGPDTPARRTLPDRHYRSNFEL